MQASFILKVISNTLACDMFFGKKKQIQRHLHRLYKGISVNLPLLIYVFFFLKQ